MSDRKNLDERSERSTPLNIDENKAVKKDGSDVETIRGDLEVPEPLPQKKHK